MPSLPHHPDDRTVFASKIKPSELARFAESMTRNGVVSVKVEVFYSMYTVLRGAYTSRQARGRTTVPLNLAVSWTWLRR